MATGAQWMPRALCIDTCVMGVLLYSSAVVPISDTGGFVRRLEQDWAMVLKFMAKAAVRAASATAPQPVMCWDNISHKNAVELHSITYQILLASIPAEYQREGDDQEVADWIETEMDRFLVFDRFR